MSSTWASRCKRRRGKTPGPSSSHIRYARLDGPIQLDAHPDISHFSLDRHVASICFLSHLAPHCAVLSLDCTGGACSITSPSHTPAHAFGEHSAGLRGPHSPELV